MPTRPFRRAGVLRTPLGATAVTLLAAVVLLAVLAPVVWGDRAGAVDTAHILQGPSSRHWAGTDSLGRDIFFRVLVATRLSVDVERVRVFEVASVAVG